MMVELKTGIGMDVRVGRMSSRRGFSFFLLLAGLEVLLLLLLLEERESERGDGWSPVEERDDRSMPMFMWRREGEPRDVLNELRI